MEACVIFKGKTVSAIVLAAGSGNRMNVSINKVYLSLDSHSIPALHYSLAALEKNPYVDDIVIAVRPEDRTHIRDIIIHEKFPTKPVWIALGGERRSDSVYNALEQVSGDIVLVHDGARPLLKQRYINDCIEAMERDAGAVVAVKCTDTICIADERGYCAGRSDRDSMYHIQTPQCFHTRILKECHEKVADKSKVTDDSALLEASGYAVKLLKGGHSNIKLTLPTDVHMAEQLIMNDEEISNLLI